MATVDEVVSSSIESVLSAVESFGAVESPRIEIISLLREEDDQQDGDLVITIFPTGEASRDVIAQKPAYQTWSMRLETLSNSVYGATLGEEISEEIYSLTANYGVSEAGQASIVLQNDKTYLAGARIALYVTVNDDPERLVFTGWCDNETSLGYDHRTNETTLSLKDSLSWLADNRRPVTMRVRGTNNAIRAGLIASDIGEDWYELWAGNVPDEETPGETRREVIQRVLDYVGFPYAATYPSDGGVVGWDVEITEETPLDVIRHLAESAHWVFIAKEDGSIEFREYNSPPENVTIYTREYDMEPGVQVNWGGVFYNQVQVRGIPKKYAAFQYVLHENLETVDFEFLNLYQGTGVDMRVEIAGMLKQKPNGTTGDVQLNVYRNVDIAGIRNSEGHKLFVKYVNAIPEEDQQGDLISAAPEFATALANRRILLSLGKDEVIEEISLGSFTTILATDRYTDYVFLDFTVSGSSIRVSNSAKEALGFYIYTHFPDLDHYVKNDQDGTITSPGFVPSNYKIYLRGERLESVDIDDQASSIVAWNESQASLGVYVGQIYENPFISTEEECIEMGDMLIRSAHRLGTVDVTCPWLSKLYTKGLGSSMRVQKTDGNYLSGLFDSMALNFDGQSGRIDMQVSMKTDTISGLPDATGLQV